MALRTVARFGDHAEHREAVVRHGPACAARIRLRGIFNGVPFMSENRFPSRRFFVFGLLLESGMGLVALFLGLLLGLPMREWLQPDGMSVVIGLYATLPIILGYLALDSSRWKPLAGIRKIVRFFSTELLGDYSPGTLAILCVAAGMGEELLFRGLILGGILTCDGLTGSATLWTALLLSATCFALAHAITKTYVVLTFVIGMYFGLLFLWTDSLWPVMIAHALYDFFVFWFVRKAESVQ
ncbi:MAG TPA: hypothetical protein DEB39_10015 [Planctomycetaceae bacterium]|nr:hypothetical protein [Planctomycetaceae bacterium]